MVVKDNSTGTAQYSDGAVVMVISNEWNEDTLKGKVEIRDGVVTMSGTYDESSPRRKVSYTGTWTAIRAQ